jgi:hypothetical protein
MKTAQIPLVFKDEYDLKEVKGINKRLVNLSKSLEYLYMLVAQAEEVYTLRNRQRCEWAIVHVDEWLEILHHTLRMLPAFEEQFKKISTTLTVYNEIDLEQLKAAYKNVKRNTTQLIAWFDHYPDKDVETIYGKVLGHLEDDVNKLGVKMGIQDELGYDI